VENDLFLEVKLLVVSAVFIALTTVARGDVPAASMGKALKGTAAMNINWLPHKSGS